MARWQKSPKKLCVKCDSKKNVTAHPENSGLFIVDCFMRVYNDLRNHDTVL